MCKKKICTECGWNVDEDELREIDVGLPTARLVCDTCAGEMEDSGKLIRCEACGEMFLASSLHDEKIYGQSFTACPHCGFDVVDGLSRVEFKEEYAPDRFVAIVNYANGEARGMTVEADSLAEAYSRIIDCHVKRGNAGGIQSVSCSRILWNKDEIKLSGEDEPQDCGTTACAYNNGGECRFQAVFDRPPVVTEEDGCTDGVIKDGIINV